MADLPDWQPVEGVSPPVPEGGGPGRVVALVASERAISEGWAAGAAVELARAWSRTGLRVVLVDGGLRAPSLHDPAGVTNREGLTDATLFGASVGRVSKPVDGGDFFLIPAGSPVADPRSVVRNPRWHRLSAGMVDADVTMLLFVRDGESGTAAFLGSASDIVVLGAQGDAPPAAIRDLEPLVRAVAGQAGGRGRSPAPDVARSAAAPVEGSGGIVKMIVFLIVVLVVAAVLGLVLVG